MNQQGSSGSGYDPVALMRAQLRNENAATIEGTVEEWLIGKDATDSKIIDALWKRGLKLRIAQRHGCWDFSVRPRDYDLSRINVNVDDNCHVVSVLGKG